MRKRLALYGLPKRPVAAVPVGPVLVLRCEPTAMDEQDRAILVYVDPEQASDSDTRVRFVCVGKNAECEI